MNGLSTIKSIPTKNSAEYLRRINLALDFIDQNLDQTIRLEDVARASCFSAFHFHRIFHAMMKETVNDYITRKRMEKAVKRLLRESQTSVTVIAASGGFSSSANFARAFKQYYGVSPSDVRNGHRIIPVNDGKNGKLFSKYGKAFKPQDLYSQFVTRTGVFDPDKLEEILMKVQIEHKPQQAIAYLSSPGGYELDSVFATWDKLIQWGESWGIDANSQARYAIAHDNPTITPEDKCRYDAAIVIHPGIQVAAPFKQSVLPEGQYAIAYFRDDAEKVTPFVTELYSNWFCNSGYEPDDYPLVFNYLNDSRKDGIVEMNVCIKVKKLGV